jgi:hypothetical protein
MYIDKFVKTSFYDSTKVDPSFSVLATDTNCDGIYEKEDAMLDYASENHITYLALYDLHRIFGRQLYAWDENQNRTVDLEEHLFRFIKKAKSKYGVTLIGAIGGSERFFDSLKTYLERFPRADFDVVNTEFEFWTNCFLEFGNFISIQNAMFQMKENYNLAHPDNKIISEVYLAALYSCNSSVGNQAAVQTIDGCINCSPCSGCANPHPRMSDRILHAWYVVNPGSMNLAEQNYFEIPSSEDSTDFHPILYAESYNTGGTVDMTGIWFPLSPANNIFTAEEAYYTAWRNNSAVAFGTPRQNNVQAGGVQWFTATNMVGHLSQPQILQNTGPYCSSNNSTRVNFNYYGPIESNIFFQFWITRNSDSSTVYPTAGGRVNGVSGNYQALTSSTALIKNINFEDTLIFKPCYLPAGDYTAHLLLNYNGGDGKSYQCNNTVIVDSRPRIEINGPSQFCEGGYTYLKVNNASGTVSWKKNGILIPGSGHELKITEDGDYSCTISGGSGCSGTSDTVHVHVLSNPSIAVNAVCNGNGTATLKTNLLTADSASTETSGPGGVLYRWNTGETTDQITVTPPTTNTYYNVNVTNPYTGCMRTAQIGLKSPLQSPHLASITVNNLPSSSCSSDGSLTAILNAGGSPNNYLWSNGATTQTISNLSPGKYSVAMNVWAFGCTSYDSIVLGVESANGPSVQPIIQHVSCEGGSDGSIQLNVPGGFPPFDFFWKNLPDDSIHNPFMKDQSSLYEGIYTIKITDALGCIYSHSFEINALNSPPAIQTSVTPVTGCATSMNGSATVIVSGGNPPFSYFWNDTLHQTTSTATALSAGSLLVTVVDLNGCSAKKIVNIPSEILPLQADLLDSSRSQVSCAGAQDGSLYVNIHGGIAPYIISSPWDVDSNFAWSDSLASGNYLIEVTDSMGCLFTDTFTISIPEPVLLYTSSDSASCIGCSDGSIDVSYSGGFPPFQISWLPANGIFTGNKIQNLPRGIYTICVTDKNGCMNCIQDSIFESTLGIFKLTIYDLLKVYPNPFSESTIVSFTSSRIRNGTLSVSTIEGKMVMNKKISTEPVIIFKNELNPGIYFLRLSNDKNGLINGVMKLIVTD